MNPAENEVACAGAVGGALQVWVRSCPPGMEHVDGKCKGPFSCGLFCSGVIVDNF